MNDREPQSAPSIYSVERVSLNYAPPEPSGAPAWVWVVIALYLMLVVALLAAPTWMYKEMDPSLGLISGAVVATLILCGLALLWIPVRIARRRPITRRSILVPIAAAGLLLGGLVLGGGWAVAELCAPGVHVFGNNLPARGSYSYTATIGSSGHTFSGSGNFSGTEVEHAPADRTLWIIAAAAVGVWIAWFVIFAVITRRRDPTGLGMKLHRVLIAGSVLELLIAVPAHIVVRRRNECCAGIYTGTGICLGVGIAIISFGPAIFLLYHRRCRQIAIPRQSPPDSGMSGMGVPPMCAGSDLKPLKVRTREAVNAPQSEEVLIAPILLPAMPGDQPVSATGLSSINVQTGDGSSD